LVGYTNAGKSTLLNRLTDAGVLVEDRLFSTLDPRTRRLRLPSGENVLLSDTVGFVRKLPHQLVEAFRSTLEVVRESDLLVHVVDGSAEFRAERSAHGPIGGPVDDPVDDLVLPMVDDPIGQVDRQIDAVRTVLEEIEAGDVPELLVVNKIDIDPRSKALVDRYPGALACSAVTGEGVDRLLDAMGSVIDGSLTERVGR
jgi:GTP-binding protein HflX